MSDCLFCKIVEGELPSKKIYEDDKVVAFLDIFPLTKGHTLVVPKEHVKELTECDDELLCHVIKVTKKLAKHIEEVCKSDGVTIYENEGLHQEMPHFHMHILPTYENERGIKWLKTEIEYDLDEIHEQIKL